MYVVFTHPPTIRPKDLVIVVLQIRQFIEVENAISWQICFWGEQSLVTLDSKVNWKPYQES